MKLRYDRHAIRRLREARGIAILTLARAAGITDRTLAYIEKGYSDPKATTLAKIAGALDVTVDALFIRKDVAA